MAYYCRFAVISMSKHFDTYHLCGFPPLPKWLKLLASLSETSAQP